MTVLPGLLHGYVTVLPCPALPCGLVSVSARILGRNGCLPRAFRVFRCGKLVQLGVAL